MSSRMKGIPCALGLLSLLVTAGCSAISGPDTATLEAKQRAAVKGNFVPLKLSLSKIMVRPLQGTASARPSVGIAGPIEVAAGPQRLFATFCAPSGGQFSCRSPRILEFDAEAGHLYRVDGSFNKQMWIVDTESGAVVSRSDGFTQLTATATF